jgi:hypothetical protein
MRRFMGGEEAVANDAIAARQTPAQGRMRPLGHLPQAVGEAPVLREPSLGCGCVRPNSKIGFGTGRACGVPHASVVRRRLRAPDAPGAGR